MTELLHVFQCAANRVQYSKASALVQNLYNRCLADSDRMVTYRCEAGGNLVLLTTVLQFDTAAQFGQKHTRRRYVLLIVHLGYNLLKPSG